MVARSLRISRQTHLMVAVVAAAVALNASVAMQFVSVAGQAALMVTLFASLAAGLYAISTDIYARSSQTVSNLRTIGATRKAISYAVILSMIGYGVAGSALGAVFGTALGGVFGGSALQATVSALGAVAVIAASSGAVAAGVYLGGRLSWRS